MPPCPDHGGVTNGPDAPRMIAGYRLVRQLASGSRADVYLGAGEAGSVALKVFREDVPSESIAAEVEALHRVDSAHVTRLLDVGGDGRGRPILVLERVPRGSVTAIVREYEVLAPGEVVTLVAPIAHELQVLHAAGIAHCRIQATNVHLDASGAPVLLGFGHVELFARGASIASLEAHPGAAADREGLAALTAGLLTTVRGTDPANRDAEFGEWLASAAREVDFATQLEARLFDLADPVPIGARDRRGEGGQVPSRVIVTGWAAEADTGRRAEVAPAQPVTAPDTVRGGVIDVLHELLAESPVEVLKKRAITLVRGVRKPIWALAGAVLVALVLVVALLPAGTANRPSAARSRSAPAPIEPTPTVLPDQADQALPILLRERNECVRVRSVLCLENVDEASSGAWDDDSELIEEAQGGGEIPKSALIDTTSPSLIELLGDTAVLRLGAAKSGQPAMVLLIKDPAGWRIRSYFSGVPSTGTPNSGD